jgi:hypothetical protein
MGVRGEVHMHPIFFLGRLPQVVNGKSLSTPQVTVWMRWKANV